MKLLLRICIIVSILFGCLQNSNAENLRSEYREIERKRQKLERQRRSYEKQLNFLNSQENTLNRLLAECVSQQPETEWQSKLDEIRKAEEKLEARRAEISELRIRLDKKRIEIEQARIGIEKKFSNKDPGSEYETEFRKYMEELNSEYITPVETKLLQSFEQYLSGLENHVLMMKEASDLCKSRKAE